MMDEKQEKILVKTSDSQHISVSIKMLNCCNLGKSNKSNNYTIDSEAEVVEKVIEFLKRHNFENFTEIPKPLPHCNFELLAEDDYGFVKDLSDDMKVRLIKCTKSIGLKPLNDLICGYIAAQYRDMQIKDIKEKYQPNNPDAFKDLEK